MPLTQAIDKATVLVPTNHLVTSCLPPSVPSFPFDTPFSNLQYLSLLQVYPIYIYLGHSRQFVPEEATSLPIYILRVAPSSTRLSVDNRSPDP